MNNLDQLPALRTKTGSTIEVHREGSLGLLALGDIGLQLWRRAKLAHHQNSKTSTFKSYSSIPKTTPS